MTLDPDPPNPPFQCAFFSLVIPHQFATLWTLGAYFCFLGRVLRSPPFGELPTAMLPTVTAQNVRILELTLFCPVLPLWIVTSCFSEARRLLFPSTSLCPVVVLIDFL